MGKILYLQCNMGAAGDMLNAALYELLSYEDKAKYLDIMNDNDLGIRVLMSEDIKCGIHGTHMSVLINGQIEGSEKNHDGMQCCCHSHEHDLHHGHGQNDGQNHSHDHHHDHVLSHHAHVSLDDIENMISSFDVPEAVKAKSFDVYRLIAKAESHAHNVEVSEVHFHEVGMLDAIADVVGACLIINMIGADKVIVSDINVGFGKVRCSHGILPVPAPATAYILVGAPIHQGSIEGEMCTPTGAALLMNIRDAFGKMPAMKIEKTGYGMGTREFEELNCVRAFLGESSEIEKGQQKIEQILELSCNIDDMTGEEIGYACERIMEAGALDVYTQAIYMKKNRPGVKLVCLAYLSDEIAITELILKYTTSWGVRSQVMNRRYLDKRFETVETEHGPVRVKIGEGYGITKSKPEYEDVANLARKENISVTWGRGIN